MVLFFIQYLRKTAHFVLLVSFIYSALFPSWAWAMDTKPKNYDEDNESNANTSVLSRSTSFSVLDSLGNEIFDEF